MARPIHDIPGESGPARTTPKAKIVVVDDNVVMLSSLKTILSRFYDVDAQSTAVFGVAAALREGVACVILDVKMPEHDGLWAFKQIREVKPKIPIIFNSAYQNAALPENLALSYDSFAYLQKGCDLNFFLETVANAVRAGEAASKGR
jgi:two-component system response regulator AtoC